MKTTEFLPVCYHKQELNVAVQKRLVSDDLIVFLHGFGCAKECFSSAFRQESLRKYSICTFDFPGHGDSALAGRSAYSMQAYAEMTNQLIDWLSPERVYLACHSMGGAVGLIASQGRENVECYISIDGNLVAEDCGLVSRQTAAQTSTEYSSSGYSDFLTQLRRSPRRDYATWAKWCAKADPIALHENAVSLVEWSDSGKLLDLFSSLPRKAYFHGDADDKQYLASSLMGAVVYTIPDAGHFMMIDNPQSFYANLAELLQDSAVAHSL
jgi:pimeloyl-ACP methyl ester carboxylesterase